MFTGLIEATSPILNIQNTKQVTSFEIENTKFNDLDEYLLKLDLSDENKAHCASAIITVSFDPNIIYIDNNSTVYLNSYNRETEKINNYDYINKFTFKMDSSSSSLVKFYKRDVSKDYSNDNDIVTVSYEF